MLRQLPRTRQTTLGRLLREASALRPFAAAGDWAFSFLHLGFYASEVWTNVPYGIMIGPALLLFLFMQTAATDVLMSLAIRRAERRE